MRTSDHEPVIRSGGRKGRRSIVGLLALVAVAATLIASAPAASAGTRSLAIEALAGNSANAIAFDVKIAGEREIAIDKLDLHLRDCTDPANCGGEGPLHDVEIWTRAGTHVGHLATTDGWTKVGSWTGVSGADKTHTTVGPLATEVIVAPGATQAFAVVSNITTGVRYREDGADPGVGTIEASDAFITIFEGTGFRNFGGTEIPDRVPEVVVHYSPFIRVTVEQQPTQGDPAFGAAIDFDVTFSAPVSDFAASDVVFTGSNAPGALSAAVTGSGTAYVVTVTGMTGPGSVVPSVPAGVASAGEALNKASTSVDNAVRYSPGYRMVASDGGVFVFGDRAFRGSTGDIKLNKPIVAGATDPSSRNGYWLVASDGGVFAFGAAFHGSLAGTTITSPAVAIEPTPTGKGYWIAQANGKVSKFGDAELFGDGVSIKLNQPVIGMSATPTGKGYWLVGSDGGIFAFGDAAFLGSLGDKKLNAPIIDLAPMPDNKGYYLLGADGGVFTFGTAPFRGSTGDKKLNAPVVAMEVDASGTGYLFVASDGGVFTFGNTPFLGSLGNLKLNSPVLDLIG